MPEQSLAYRGEPPNGIGAAMIPLSEFGADGYRSLSYSSTSLFWKA